MWKIRAGNLSHICCHLLQHGHIFYVLFSKKKTKRFLSDVTGQPSPPLQPFHLPARCHISSSPSGYKYEAFQPITEPFVHQPMTDFTGCMAQNHESYCSLCVCKPVKATCRLFLNVFPYHSYDYYMLGKKTCT